MHHPTSKLGLTLSLAILTLSTTLHAQQLSTSADLPSAPAPTLLADATSSSSSASQPLTLDAPLQQTASTDQATEQGPAQTSPHPRHPPQLPRRQRRPEASPQSVKDKFVTASEDSFDYSSIFIPLAVAGWSLHENSVPEFGGGGVGYGRYLWHAVVDQTSENFLVEAIVPSITHEDNRYYTLGHGGFIKRTGYALSRVVVTRSDSGREVFNISEVVGSGASAGLSSLYYPSRERSIGNTGSQWGLDIGIDAASFVVKEFWPDINHYLFHGAKPSTHPADSQ